MVHVLLIIFYWTVLFDFGLEVVTSRIVLARAEPSFFAKFTSRAEPAREPAYVYEPSQGKSKLMWQKKAFLTYIWGKIGF